MKLMGLDIGDATIGIALSDTLQIMAQGLETYRRVSNKQDIDYLVTLIAEHDVQIVVAGEPINMNGSKGPQHEKTMSFLRLLEKKLRHTDRIDHDVAIETIDERLTSMQANRLMLEGNLRRDRRKTLIDRIAAQIILQTYLDRRTQKG